MARKPTKTGSIKLGTMGFANPNPRPLNTPGPFAPPKQQRQAGVKIAKLRNVTAGTINTNPVQGRMPRPQLPRGNVVGTDQAFARRDQLVRPPGRMTNTIKKRDQLTQNSGVGQRMNCTIPTQPPHSSHPTKQISNR